MTTSTRDGKEAEREKDLQLALASPPGPIVPAPKTDWVPVAEALPADGQFVLVRTLTVAGDMMHVAKHGHAFDKKWSLGLGRGISVSCVTHWTTLPSGPLVTEAGE